MGRAVVVASGGMDSITAAWRTKAQGDDVLLVGFDYGQRHSKELACLRKQGELLDAEVKIIDLTDLGQHLTSALTSSDQEVPEGHYADETMKATVVPNRNMIMASIAAGIAVSNDCDAIVLGVHAGDHPIYADCRPEFVEALDAAIYLGADQKLEVRAPFVKLTKAEIARIGGDLGVAYEHTWSCYKGGAKHCGKCGTCVERKEAFELAAVIDPTEYEEA